MGIIFFMILITPLLTFIFILSNLHISAQMIEGKKAAFILHKKGAESVSFSTKSIYTEGPFFHETWGLTLLSFSRGGGRNGNITKRHGKSPVLTMELHILYLNDTPACGQVFYFFYFHGLLVFCVYFYDESQQKKKKKENW